MADDPWDAYIGLVRTGERTQEEFAQQRRQAINSAREQLNERRSEVAGLRQRIKAVASRIEGIDADGQSLAMANGVTVPSNPTGLSVSIGSDLSATVGECERSLRYVEQLLEAARSATLRAETESRHRAVEARRVELQNQRADDMKQLALAVAGGVGGFLLFCVLGNWGVVPAVVAVGLSLASLTGATAWVQQRSPRAALEVTGIWNTAYDPIEYLAEVPEAGRGVIWVGAGGLAVVLCIVAAWPGTNLYLLAAVGLVASGVIGRESISGWFRACQDLSTATEQGDGDD